MGAARIGTLQSCAGARGLAPESGNGFGGQASISARPVWHAVGALATLLLATARETFRPCLPWEFSLKGHLVNRSALRRHPRRRDKTRPGSAWRQLGPVLDKQAGSQNYEKSYGEAGTPPQPGSRARVLCPPLLRRRGDSAGCRAQSRRRGPLAAPIPRRSGADAAPILQPDPRSCGPTARPEPPPRIRPAAEGRGSPAADPVFKPPLRNAGRRVRVALGANEMKTLATCTSKSKRRPLFNLSFNRKSTRAPLRDSLVPSRLHC